MSTSENLDPVQEALLQEQCILVDKHDKALGQASKRECHLLDSSGKAPLHRAFSLFIFNKDNELLMQQRSDTKVTFPGLWTNTCCSHPLAIPNEMGTQDGVGAKNAAQRKVFNELGIRADQCPVEPMEYLTRIEYAAPSFGGKWGENEIDYILFLKTDTELDVDPNPEEVKDVAYVKLANLDKFLHKVSIDGITPWFALMAKTLLPKWWSNLDNLEKFKDHNNIMRY